MNYYLTQNGQQLGPYSTEQIQTFICQGLALPNDLVWAEGWPSWLPLSQVPGINIQSGAAARACPPMVDTGAGSHPKGLNLICIWMHLSQFTAFITLLSGYVLPIVIWQTNKQSHPIIDKQGRIIANWIISSLIYDVLVIFLCLFWIGFLIAPVLFVIECVFPIVGAIKASQGETWKYPMSINFFSV